MCYINELKFHFNIKQNNQMNGDDHACSISIMVWK